jgi:hypothetical protein
MEHAMKKLLIGAAALALAAATPALAQTTQFMISGAPVTVGAMPASEGHGYSVYHYRQKGGPGSVNVNCLCDGAKATTATCDNVQYQCNCPSGKLICSGS